MFSRKSGNYFQTVLDWSVFFPIFLWNNRRFRPIEYMELFLQSLGANWFRRGY